MHSLLFESYFKKYKVINLSEFSQSRYYLLIHLQKLYFTLIKINSVTFIPLCSISILGCLFLLSKGQIVYDTLPTEVFLGGPVPDLAKMLR